MFPNESTAQCNGEQVGRPKRSALIVMPTGSPLNVADTPSVTQLSQVISQSAAPAFLLGALGAFIAILIS
jgi:hypothetical protein